MTIVDNILTEFREITEQERQARTQLAARADRRGELIRMLQASGWSYARIAKATGLTYQRIGQLAKRGQ